MRSGGVPLSPISPLLAGLDETDPNRSRGSAYWRRARMCLRIASIADYWSKESVKSMGTPMPGRMPGEQGLIPQMAGLQMAAADGSPMPPKLAGVSGKVDAAVSGAVLSQLLTIALNDTPPAEGGGTPARKRRTSESAKAEAAAKAAVDAAGVAVAEIRKEGGDEVSAMGVQLEAMHSGAAKSTAFTDAMAQAPAVVSGVLNTIVAVLDHNMPPLTAHLHTILRDGVAASVRQLQAKAATSGKPATEESARHKAAGVIETLRAAVADAERQFVTGVRDHAPPHHALRPPTRC